MSVVSLVLNEIHTHNSVGNLENDSIKLDVPNWALGIDSCTPKMLAHAAKYSNVFDNVHDHIYLDYIGLPEGMDNEEFNVCFDVLITAAKKQKESDEELAVVLQWCDDFKSGKDVFLPGLSWNNSTHHIDNTDCEFFPNDEIYEQEITQGKVSLDPKVYPLPDKLQLQRVLDHCENQSLGIPQTEPFLEFHNSTHHIDNIDCEWIIDEGLMHSPYGMIPYDDYRQDDNIKTGIYLNNTFIPDVD